MSKARPASVPKPTQSQRPSRRKPELPTIVAVGASAGGLEAFSELLAALPRDAAALNMAFVFLQHLQPGHRSLLAELLQKSTFLHVQHAGDGVTPPRRSSATAAPPISMPSGSAPKARSPAS